MRLLSILLAFVCLGTSSYADCADDHVIGRGDSASRLANEVSDLVSCLEERMKRLEATNRALREQVGALEAIASQVPSSYLEINGRSNGATPPFASASFDLAAKPKGRVFDMALDHDVILDLCADAEGCVISLSSSSEAARASQSLGKTGPCDLSYDQESGDWALGAECGGGWGVDGGGRLPGADSPEGSVILNVGSDCALTGSALDVRADDTGRAQLSTDRKQGLFLISGLPVPDGGAVEDDYSCRLSLRD